MNISQAITENKPVQKYHLSAGRYKFSLHKFYSGLYFPRLEERMIVGIGIDIIKVERLEKAIGRHGERFTKRVFTNSELVYCSGKKTRYESLAARFSVKEAAFKALGRGWDECGGFTSVEVVSDSNRRPSIVFHGKAKHYAESLNVSNAFVTITHDSGIAAAVVVLEG